MGGKEIFRVETGAVDIGVGTLEVTQAPQAADKLLKVELRRPGRITQEMTWRTEEDLGHEYPLQTDLALGYFGGSLQPPLFFIFCLDTNPQRIGGGT